MRLPRRPHRSRSGGIRWSVPERRRLRQPSCNCNSFVSERKADRGQICSWKTQRKEEKEKLLTHCHLVPAVDIVPDRDGGGSALTRTAIGTRCSVCVPHGTKVRWRRAVRMPVAGGGSCPRAVDSTQSLTSRGTGRSASCSATITTDRATSAPCCHAWPH